jgi:hypothetical protein
MPHAFDAMPAGDPIPPLINVVGDNQRGEAEEAPAERS